MSVGFEFIHFTIWQNLVLHRWDGDLKIFLENEFSFQHLHARGSNQTDELVPNFASLLVKSAEIPQVLFNPNDVPSLPDVLSLDDDDSLANNRLLSAELGAQQASAFGLF